MDAFEQPVARYMTPATYTVGVRASLAEVDLQMALRGVSALVVVDEQARPIGMVTRTDLLQAGRPYDGPSGRRKLELSDRLVAGDVLHADPVCIEHDASLRAAARLLAKRSVHRLLVVNGVDPVGVLSVTDLLHVVSASSLDTPLSELMSETIASVGPEQSVAYAAERLVAAGVRGLVVMDDGHPVGAFTQREALAAQGANDDARVAEWMAPSVAVLDADTRLPLAAKQALLTHAALIVVVVDGTPKGVVTATDMVYALI